MLARFEGECGSADLRAVGCRQRSRLRSGVSRNPDPDNSTLSRCTRARATGSWYGIIERRKAVSPIVVWIRISAKQPKKMTSEPAISALLAAFARCTASGSHYVGGTLRAGYSPAMADHNPLSRSRNRLWIAVAAIAACPAATLI